MSQWEVTIRALLTSRLTRKAQATVPKKVRDLLRVGRGDMLGYEIRDGRVTLTRVEGIGLLYLQSLQETLSEWNSKDNAAAYDDL
jgi:bifunctional DNA-binding transcriptional regulator/antitoxin component of YhaV-PrlF toxin-antitoxin module